jgi:GxxExxY protein
MSSPKALEREEARLAKKMAKERERMAKKAEKEAAKAASPPKKARSKPKAKLSVAPPVVVDMPVYSKLEMMRGFATEVAESLGAGHLESIYHAAMAVELRQAGIMYESEQVMPVTYKGAYVGTVRADIIVNKECVLEFKISGKIEDAKQQARQYMKLQGISYGFVVMFPKSDGGAVQFVDARLPDEAE